MHTPSTSSPADPNARPERDRFGRRLVQTQLDGLTLEGVHQPDGSFWNCTPPHDTRDCATAFLNLISQPEISQLNLQSLALLLNIHLRPGELSLDELSDQSSSRATTFRCLARLIELGLIEASDHPLDRRRTIYTHTAAGLRLLKACLGSVRMTE